MKKLLTWIYVIFGILNALLFWLFAPLDLNVGGDKWLNIALAAFLVSTMILMRTPFSRKRIDHPLVSIIRWSLAAFLGYLEWKIYNAPEMVQDNKIAFGIMTIVGLSIFLLIGVKELRREFIIDK